jgi:hypothetical protein
MHFGSYRQRDDGRMKDERLAVQASLHPLKYRKRSPILFPGWE